MSIDGTQGQKEGDSPSGCFIARQRYPRQLCFPPTPTPAATFAFRADVANQNSALRFSLSLFRSESQRTWVKKITTSGKPRQRMPQERRRLIAINQNCTHLEVGFISIKAKCGSDCYDNIDLRNLETKKKEGSCWAQAVEV